MAITKLEEWSETAASNTEMNGISLAENVMRPPAVNNEMREHMAQVAKWLGDDTLASATTTDLGSVPGRYVSVTGTTTITGLGTIKAGTVKYVKFTGILTLTHNGTSLILPGATSIVTAGGDMAIFVSEGSGNWRCVSFMRAAHSTMGGTFTPTDDSGAGLSFASASGTFLRVGNRIFVNAAVSYPVTANGSNAAIGGWPSAPFTAADRGGVGVSYANDTDVAYAQFPTPGSAILALSNDAGTTLTNAQLSGATVFLMGSYSVS